MKTIYIPYIGPVLGIYKILLDLVFGKFKKCTFFSFEFPFYLTLNKKISVINSYISSPKMGGRDKEHNLLIW